MPKSKREKVVALTKTGKKGRKLKEDLVEQVRECVSNFAYIYIFKVHNMRNQTLKEIRQDWSVSRFFFGKNKVMQLALGATPETEVEDGVCNLARRIRADCGLMFVDATPEEVQAYFDKKKTINFARSGFEPQETIVIPAGHLLQFSHALEPHLRKLGMPTRLDKGTIELLADTAICQEGVPLTPEQAKLLQLFEKPIAEFSITLDCVWHDGKFTKLADDDDDDDDDEGGDDEGAAAPM